MASPGAGPSAPAELPPMSEEGLIPESFFHCGAQELALKLIGRYIHFEDNKSVVRILETEAYPEGDGVYKRRFPDDVTARFRALNGGTLRAWGSPSGGHSKSFNHIYVSAGPVGTGDVVLLRSCETILGYCWDFTTSPNLYIPEGAQLLPGFVAEGERLTHGVRVLKKDDDVEGADSMLRFALRTAMSFHYEKGKGLVDYTAPV